MRVSWASRGVSIRNGVRLTTENSSRKPWEERTRWTTCIPAKSKARSVAPARGTQTRFELLRDFDAAPTVAAEMGEDMWTRRLAEYLPVEKCAGPTGGSE